MNVFYIVLFILMLAVFLAVFTHGVNQLIGINDSLALINKNESTLQVVDELRGIKEVLKRISKRQEQ